MGRVVVAGSVNMDVSARVQQQPRPGETVFGSDLLFTPGGKGSNQAVAASRLLSGGAISGAAVAFIGKIGADAFGRELRAFLERERLDLTGLHESTRQASGTALISVDEAGENQIIVIPGSNAELAADEVARAPLGPGDIAAAVFEIPQETIVAFFRGARDRGAQTLLNPAPYAAFHPDLAPLCDVILLNEVELAGLAGLPAVPREAGPCLAVMRAWCANPRRRRSSSPWALRVRWPWGRRAVGACPASRWRRSIPPARAIVLSALSRRPERVGMPCPKALAFANAAAALERDAARRERGDAAVGGGVYPKSPTASADLAISLPAQTRNSNSPPPPPAPKRQPRAGCPPHWHG